MKKEDFEKLVASIKEAGQIKAGRRAPSRVYKIAKKVSSDDYPDCSCKLSSFRNFNY